MTDKRFTIGDRALQEVYGGCIPAILDGGIPCTQSEVLKLLNELHEENNKIKSILLKKVDELNDAYNKSAKAGMPTGGIIGELDSFEEICRIMEWIE